MLVSSGIREGAVPSLRVSDYSKVRTVTPDTGSGGMSLTSVGLVITVLATQVVIS